MNDRIKDLQLKLIDYRRFILTLFLLGTYLYIGAMMTTYIQHSSDGLILFIFSLAFAIAMIGFIRGYFRIKSKLDHDQRA